MAGNGPTVMTLSPWLFPAARRTTAPPRRTSTTQVTPLPQAVWACCTAASIATVAATGLFQARMARSVGEGWTARLLGFIVPGTFTVSSDGLAITERASAAVHPFTKG